MDWRDRRTDPPDETVSWAHPQHEILVWELLADRPVIALYLGDRWVDAYTNVHAEHPPVTFRYWMPLPGRPPETLSLEAWMLATWEGDEYV